MARLETLEGGWLELAPVNWQFPKGDHDRWINFVLACDFGPRRLEPTIDPAMMLVEARALVSWLRGLCDGTTPIGDEFRCLEPNFKARLAATEGRFYDLEFSLSHEWRLAEEISNQPVVTRVTRRQLETFAEQLAGELQDLTDGRLTRSRQSRIGRLFDRSSQEAGPQGWPER